MPKNLPKLIVILGPTASGKTDLAIKLAKKLAPYRTRSGAGFNGVEIVSADSRQVYKEMDIATAKPISREFARMNHEYTRIVKGIPHYLIDIVRPNQEFNVALYKKMALKAIKNIQKRGKLPFLVGGTGLYIQAIVDNIEFPEVPAQKKLREKLEKKSAGELFQIYKKLDPEGAKFIEKENKRRLIRAIEVCKITKKSFWQQRKKGETLFDILQIGVKLPKNELKKRVKKRVEKMFRLGLEEEVKKLVEKYGSKISPMQTIGYQEWKEYFEGKIKKEKVRNLIKRHTIQFAKRQMTWFKKDRRIRWTPPTHHPYRYAKKLIKKFLIK